MNQVRTIAVFRALQLGDLLCAVPSLRALRAAWPEAHIALIGLPWARDFVERFRSYVDEYIAFPGLPGLPEQASDIEAFPDFVRSMQSRRFDLVLQLQGNGSIVNPFIELLGARLTAGCYLPGTWCPGPGYIPQPEPDHEIWRMLRVIEHLGLPLQGDELEFPLNAADHAAFEAITEASSLRVQPYVCIHAGSRLPDRRWPAHHFALVADALARRGFTIVVTGTEAEREITSQVVRAASVPVVDLTGKTSLGALGALLNGAHLLVTNDTGASHMSAALRVPSVVIFSVTQPERWAPLDRRLHRIVQAQISGTGAVEHAPPERVLAEVDALLADDVPIGAQHAVETAP